MLYMFFEMPEHNLTKNKHCDANRKSFLKARVPESTAYKAHDTFCIAMLKLISFNMEFHNFNKYSRPKHTKNSF